jgi:DNA polymerase-3 subunit delta'
VAIRVAPLPEASVRQFLADPAVVDALADSGAPSGLEERMRLAQGSPGSLLAASGLREALAQATRLLAAATRGDSADGLRIAFGQGSSRARGGFSQMLDALTVLLHQRVREATGRGDPQAARTARAIEAVERAKAMATGNVNPQLLTTALLRQIGALCR